MGTTPLLLADGGCECTRQHFVLAKVNVICAGPAFDFAAGTKLFYFKREVKLRGFHRCPYAPNGDDQQIW
jgi:hypothetical protein